MSRLYDVQFKVKTLKCGAHRDIDKALREYVYDKGSGSDFDQASRVVMVEGQMSLAGGQSDIEFHEELLAELRKIDPSATLVSKWHFAEWEWDEVHGDETELEEELMA